MSQNSGKLYVVATPIGNLADISLRAIDTLKQVDLIAAEDTRHVKVLLQHYGIATKTVSFHQHNEEKMSQTLLSKLIEGISIALVSDAGTPLLSDPGMPLVIAAKSAGISVIPIPGACALVAALSAAGCPTTKFSFEGFLPRTSAARQALFNEKLNFPETWIFYESSHRILYTLKDMLAVLPSDRQIVVARELTKLYETIVKCTLQEAFQLLSDDENMRKGEFVVLVEGAKLVKQEKSLTQEQEKILITLMKQCSTKTAVDLAVELTGVRRKLMYQAALELEKLSRVHVF